MTGGGGPGVVGPSPSGAGPSGVQQHGMGGMVQVNSMGPGPSFNMNSNRGTYVCAGAIFKIRRLHLEKVLLLLLFFACLQATGTTQLVQ